MFVFPIIALVFIWVHMCWTKTGCVRLSLTRVRISNNKIVYRFKKKTKKKTHIFTCRHTKGAKVYELYEGNNKRKAQQLIAGGHTGVKDMPRM